ncbi:MAG: Gfo/Idh/MocA family oxidoreductase [archaeon]
MVNFAIVGCGRVSGKHISSLKQIPKAKIVAVCDTKESRAIEVAKDCQCKCYFDYDEMLRNPEIEVVNICAPTGMHAEMTVKAAKADKHIVCEKPIALTMKDATEMIKACKENNVKLFIVKQNRYNPPIMHLKKAIEVGRFGKIYIANTTIRWSRNQQYYDQDEWRGTILQDGGVLMNQTAHHTDMLRWLVGDVESVFCKKDTFAHKIETEDSAVAVLKFKNGAIGTYEGTTCTFPKDLKGSISVLGERGSVEIGGFAMNKMDIWQFSETLPEDAEIVHTITNPPNVYGYGHLPLLQEVVECIHKGVPEKISGDDAKETLRLIVAMLKSAKENKEVRLDEISNEDDNYY